MPAEPEPVTGDDLTRINRIAHQWLNNPDAGEEQHYMALATLRLIARGHVLTARLDESRRARRQLEGGTK